MQPISLMKQHSYDKLATSDVGHVILELPVVSSVS